MRLVQLTDLHLGKDTHRMHFGMCPYDSLLALFQLIRERCADCDRIVITGDVAHDEARETYVVLRDALGDLVDRCLFIPGNHDVREFMAEVFPSRVRMDGGRTTFVDELHQWRLIGLDTHVPGKGYGDIDDKQLRWLEHELAHTQSTLLFLHHQPIPVGSFWIDRIGLRSSDSLQDIVTRHPHIRAVFHGHTHQSFHGRIATTDVYGTPSTCFQFRPGKALPLLDRDAGPGFRSIELNGTEMTTRIVRVDKTRFRPTRRLAI